MEVARLFLRTLEDIENRLQSNDWYEILGISSLIRKLFLDDHPLVEQVNRTYRQKLRFTITDPHSPHIQTALSMKPDYFILSDGLDPVTSIPSSKKAEVNRDQFFGTAVCVINGNMYSVREIVLFEANIMGAIHSGAAKTDKEKALAELNSFFVGSDVRVATYQLKSIARVVIRALQPLRENILNAA
jgi:hypothetical protein